MARELKGGTPPKADRELNRDRHKVSERSKERFRLFRFERGQDGRPTAQSSNQSPPREAVMAIEAAVLPLLPKALAARERRTRNSARQIP